MDFICINYGLFLGKFEIKSSRTVIFYRNLEEKIFPEFKHLAIPNYFKGTSGTPEELYSLTDVGLSEGKIRAEIGKLLAQKK